MIRRLVTWARLYYFEIHVHDLEVARFHSRNVYEKKKLDGKIKELKKKLEIALDKYFACRT